MKYAEKLRNLKVVTTAAALEMKPEPQQFRPRAKPWNESPSPKCDHRVPEGSEVEAFPGGLMRRRRWRTRSADQADRVPANCEGWRRAEDRCAGDRCARSLRGKDSRQPGDQFIQALEDVKIKLPEALRIRVRCMARTRSWWKAAGGCSASARGRARCCWISRSRASSARYWSRRG